MASSRHYLKGRGTETAATPSVMRETPGVLQIVSEVAALMLLILASEGKGELGKGGPLRPTVALEGQVIQ